MADDKVYFQSKVPIPEQAARGIAQRAAALIRQTAPKGQNDSRKMVRATWQKGEIGVVFPQKASHLLYIDKGVKPYIMYQLEGKTIPIRGKDGSLIFRTAKNVGRPQITARNAKGQIQWTKRQWRHPGIQAQNFVEKAFQQALKEYVAKLQGSDIVDIIRGAEGEAGEVLSKLISTSSVEYQTIKMSK